MRIARTWNLLVAMLSIARAHPPHFSRMRQFTGSAAGISITQMGTPHYAWWGLEHFPVILAAAQSPLREKPCTVVEAGAHMGTLAILAARLGCTVYAFEADQIYTDIMRRNVVLNNVSRRVHVIERNLSSQPSHRVDERVPRLHGPITVLKMDIDGHDADAMRGCDGLFAAGVDFVNVEMDPSTHLRQSNESDVTYLLEILRRGFEPFVLDCMPYTPSLERQLQAVGRGPTCLDSDVKATSHNIAHWSERPAQAALLGCLMDGKCTEATENLIRQQHLSASALQSLVQVVAARGKPWTPGHAQLDLLFVHPRRLTARMRKLLLAWQSRLA